MIRIGPVYRLDSTYTLAAVVVPAPGSHHGIEYAGITEERHVQGAILDLEKVG